jgi:hypothetical protein
MKIRSKAAMALVTAGGLCGSFISEASADVQSYLVGYQLNYRQTAPAQVDLFACAFFNAINGQPGEAATATVVSGLTGVPYEMTEVVPGVFQGGVLFTDPADMFTEFPLGSYTLSIDGGTLGAQDGDVETPNPLNLPDTIPEFDAAQIPEYDAIDGLNDYTFRFNTFTSTGNLEEAYLIIDAFPSSRRVYFGQPTPLAGEHTVPAGSLRLNRRYTATLYFLSFVEVPDAGFGSAISNVAAWRTNTVAIRTAGNCPPDYNGDGFLDFFDYSDFVEGFEAGDFDADFNGDGFLDFFDYSDFVAGFESGC